jgi:hypothetical protein
MRNRPKDNIKEALKEKRNGAVKRTELKDDKVQSMAFVNTVVIIQGT